ncbi:MAG: hypothetical protein ABJC12_03370 [Saprospiraceae bacterium]
MAKKVESIKHKSDTRAHIPSQEEAGYEDSNPKVNEGKKTLELPKNPIVHRGQDPELFWKTSTAMMIVIMCCAWIYGVCTAMSISHQKL